MEAPRRAKVLSIQSHVVHGFVGNKAAVFPLNVRGIEVDSINSVQFSNHTGYPTVKGQVLDGEQLLTILEGLEANNLLAQYTHLLTGYIGSDTFLRAVEQVLNKLRAANPHLVYVCDPVMGDEDTGLYVPAELPGIYREWVANASVCTPNAFEAEHLTGIKIASFEDAARACDVLHDKGVSTVMLTSLDLPNSDDVQMMMSRRKVSDSPAARCILAVPKIAGSFTGTGDLSAAMVLAFMEKHPYELPLALEKVAAVVQAVLIRTTETSVGVDADVRAEKKAAPPELRLIDSLDDIRNPVVYSRCTVHPRLPVKAIVFDLATLRDAHARDGPAVTALLKLLHIRGVRLVVTGAEKFAAVRFCEVARLSPTFFAVVPVALTAQSVTTAAEDVGCHPAEMLLVASESEVMAVGRSSGARPIVLHTAGTNDLAAAAAHDAVISCLDQLDRYI